MPLLTWLIPIAKQVAQWAIPYVIQKKVEEYFEKKKVKKEEAAPNPEKPQECSQEKSQ